MSHEGQAPTPGGYPQQGPPPQNPSDPAPQPGQHVPQQGQPGGHGQYAPQQGQPGQYAPQQGQHQGQPGQPGQYAPQPGQYQGQPAQQGQPVQYAPQPGQYQGQPGQQGQPSQYAPQGQQGGYAPQAPSAPRPNPFKGIPVADFVRDGVAALLLFLSLALWVTAGEKVGDSYHFVVIIVTVVSVLTLALPYLARGGVFPPSWSVHRTRLARLLGNAPYAAVTLVYVVLDVFKVEEYNFGVGTAFALGLAGAVLAAQPRQSEMGPEHLDLSAPRLWRTVTLAVAALAGLLMLVSLVIFLVNAGDAGGAIVVVAGIVGWVFTVAFIGWPVYGVLVQKSPSWRFFLVGLGAILVVAFLFGSSRSSSFLQVESVHVLSGLGFNLSLQAGLGAIFIPAIAAAVASPAFSRTLSREDTSRTWIGTALHGLDYLALVAVAGVVLTSLWFGVEGREFLGVGTGATVTTIILSLVVAAGAVFARLALARSAADGRVMALGAGGLAFVVGIVLLVVAPEGLRSVGHLVLAFGLPVLVCVALTAPKEIRTYFAQNRPAPRAAGQAAYQWSQPQGGQSPQGQQGQYGAPQQQGQYGAPQGQYGAPAQAQYGAPAQGQYGAPTGAYGTPTTDQGSPEGGYGSAPVAQQPAADQQWQAPSTSAAPDSEIDQDTHLAGYAPGVSAASVSEQHEAPQQPSSAEDSQPVAQSAPAPVAPAASHGYTAEQALDPSTTGLVLSQIVQEAPELRPQVAANPTTYPALLDWLGQLGEPAVDEALRNRQA